MRWKTRVNHADPELVVWDHIKCLPIIDKTQEERLIEFPGFLGDEPQIHYLVPSSTSGSETCLHIWDLLVHFTRYFSHNNCQKNFTSMWYQWYCPVVAADWQDSFLLRQWDEYWFCPVIWPLFLRRQPCPLCIMFGEIGTSLCQQRFGYIRPLFYLFFFTPVRHGPYSLLMQSAWKRSIWSANAK